MKYLLAFYFTIYSFSIFGQPIDLNHGTTIIAFITNDTVWVAADTKVHESASNYNKEQSSTHRKIFKTNEIVYAFSELPRPSTYNKEVYNADKIMTHFIKTQKTFEKIFEKFNDSIIKRLTVFIDSLKVNRYYSEIEEYKKKPVLGMFMIAFINGKPEFKHRTYKFNEQANGVIPIDPFVPDGFGRILWLGSQINAMNYLRSNKSYFNGFKNMTQRLICLINEEVKNNGEYVGFPVDVLILTKKWHKWYYNNKSCIIQ